MDAESGKTLCRFLISGSVNLDWEDLEVTMGPVAGESFIYIADTGDNIEKRPNYSIYRSIGPAYETSFEGKSIPLENHILKRISFVFPDGSLDIEAMMVGSTTKDIFLITNRDVVSMLYVAPYPQPINELYPIYKAGEFSFRQASAATSSMDEKKVLIRNRQEIFFGKKLGMNSWCNYFPLFQKKLLTW